MKPSIEDKKKFLDMEMVRIDRDCNFPTKIIGKQRISELIDLSIKDIEEGDFEDLSIQDLVTIKMMKGKLSRRFGGYDGRVCKET